MFLQAPAGSCGRRAWMAGESSDETGQPSCDVRSLSGRTSTLHKAISRDTLIRRDDND